MRTALGLTILLLLTSQLAAASEEPSLPDRDELEQLMQQFAVPGLSMAVIRGGRVTERLTIGVRPDAVFEAASLSKLVAAYHVFQLIESGELTLEQTMREDCGGLTLGQLLSHQAGLGNRIDSDSFLADCERVGRFGYAGEGYVILERFLSARDPQPVAEVIQARLFEPLGMSHTTLDRTSLEIVEGHPDLLFALLSRRVAGVPLTAFRWPVAFAVVTLLILLPVSRRWGRRVAAWSALPVVILSLLLFLIAAAHIQVPVSSLNRPNDLASSLKTTADDLAVFVQELMNPGLISAATRDAMLREAVHVNERTRWGYGPGIDISDDRRTWWQWGSNPGYQSLVVFDVSQQDAVIILTNGGGFADFVISDRGGYDLARHLAARALGTDGHWSLTDPD